MKTNTLKASLMRSICAILVVFLLVGQPAFAAATSTDERNLQYFQGIIDLIRDQYKGAFTDEQLVEGAVGGMLNSLDDYTTYYTPKEADTFMGSVTGVFGGIGVAMEINGDYILVSKVFSASPAEKAGIIQGDKIVEANGKSLVKVTTDEAASLIKGEVGTKVRLGILRNGVGNVQYFDVIRDIIKINPVTYEIRDGVGYIKLETFNENTDEYITNALNEMDSENITKIILDLRDNPGGEVIQAVAVARKFIPKGLITKLDYKSEKYSDIIYESYLEKPKYKLAVLVNGMSASASEIVSGAIQDTGVGKLVGTKTFGKAKFQALLPILTPEAFAKYENTLGIKVVSGFDLQMNYGIIPGNNEIAGYTKMTLGLYYTPNGRMIDGTGLVPDVAVEDPKPVSDIYINSLQKLTKTTKPTINSQGVDVYNAEKLLRALGYDVGVPDTTMDEKTASAVKAFQKDAGLFSYGVLDYSTQDALNKSLLELITKYDKQYAEAVKILN